MCHEVLLRTSSGQRRLTIDASLLASMSESERANGDTVCLFVASWVSLLADSPLNPDDKPFQTYRRFLMKIAEHGIKSMVIRYSDLAHKLVSQHTLMGSGTSIGDWIDDFKDTPVFFEYNRYYQTGDVTLLDFLYTFLNFGKKLEFVDKSFEEAAFRSWCDVEEKLADLRLDTDDLLALRMIVGVLLPRFSWRNLWPKFGPKAVAERGIHTRIEKLKNLSYDGLIDRFLLHGHIGMYGMGEDLGIHFTKVIPDPSKWAPARGVSSRISRLRFVPKNLKVARSICMEPNTLMYFQQAVLDRVTELVESSPLRSFVRLKDQSWNRGLSQYGSQTGEIDTLDLSAASDSVSLELVKAVFPPSWLIPMLATRSHSALLPDGSLRALRKFAPMGSALCFPTQCIIFASVCIYAACLHTFENSRDDQAFLCWLNPQRISRVVGLFNQQPGYYRGSYQPLGIYGDDICVDGRLTQNVKSILSRLGFSTNDSKSFVGGQSFRESCGGYYLDGHDITPLYFRVKGVREKLTPSHVVSQVQLINRAYGKSYRSLYRFLHNSIMTWECPGRYKGIASGKNSIPYVSDPRIFGILSAKPSNTHLKTRYNDDYQRDEVRAWTISHEFKDVDDRILSVIDAYEHMRWWANHTKAFFTEDDNPPVPRYDAGGSGLSWKWIPAE